MSRYAVVLISASAIAVIIATLATGLRVFSQETTPLSAQPTIKVQGSASKVIDPDQVYMILSSEAEGNGTVSALQLQQAQIHE